jgi:hypothetical protein
MPRQRRNLDVLCACGRFGYEYFKPTNRLKKNPYAPNSKLIQFPAVSELIAQLWDKYPSLCEEYLVILRAFLPHKSIIGSGQDNRKKIDPSRWLDIASFAHGHGYNAASSKLAKEITVNGKTVISKVTPHYIKRKENEVYKFAEDVIKYAPRFMKFMHDFTLMLVVDTEVRDQYFRELEKTNLPVQTKYIPEKYQYRVIRHPSGKDGPRKDCLLEN